MNCAHSVATGRAGWAVLALALVLAGCQRRVERTWPTGRQRSAGHVSLLTGREEGLWTYWFPDGHLREQGRYEDGVRVGRWKQWHANGAPRSEGERRFDRARRASPRTGFWRFWYENGKLEGCGTCVDGLREGRWEYFLEEGGLDGDRSGEYYHDELLR